MKYLKYTAYVLIALFLIYLAFGIFMPEVNYGHEITVDKPVKEAWAVSEDDSKYSQWLKGFKSVELISGEQGKPGSKYKVIINPGEGKEDIEMIETLISRDNFEQIEMHFDSDMVDFKQIIKFTEKDGKTKIKSFSNVKGKNIWLRSLLAMSETLGGTFTAQEKENFEALKILIEENTTDYYPVADEAEVLEVEASTGE